MTDLEDKIIDEPTDESAPELIATHYLTSIEDVVEHLRAASHLALGVRVRSYLEDEGEGLAERWEFELLTSSPVHHEEGQHSDDVHHHDADPDGPAAG